MKNTIAYEVLDNVHSVKINQLFWVAGATTNSDLEDLLEELDEDQITETFPDFEDYEDGITIQDLMNADKFGFFAEINIPEPMNIKYNEQGEAETWSTGAVSRLKYVYAENRKELLTKIEKIAHKTFNEYVEKDKLKK